MSEVVSENWMTKESYERLQEELEHRSGSLRSEITRKIDAARREGDLKENGGYHAAREEQSLNETRINQLKQILQDAVIGQATDDGFITPGMIVEAKVGARKMRFLLGSRDASEGLEIEVFDPQAPLGKALIGHKAGDKLDYQTPTGKSIPVEVIYVEPYQA